MSIAAFTWVCRFPIACGAAMSPFPRIYGAPITMWRNLSRLNYLSMTVGFAALVWWAGVAAAQRPDDAGGRGPQGPGGPGGAPGGFGAFGFGQPPGGFGFGGFGGGNLSNLLRRQDVRKELELLDDQIAKLDELEQAERERMRQQFENTGQDRERRRDGAGRRDGERRPEGEARRGQDAPPQAEDFRAAMEERRVAMEQREREIKEKISEILLPPQMERLEQLAIQMRLQGGAMALLNPDVLGKLDVSDEQREQLRTKAEETDRELQRKMAELRREAQAQAVATLSTEQQAKYKELIGEPFTFQSEPPRFGGPGGFGAPGGPGGPRGPGGQGRPAGSPEGRRPASDN